MTFSERLKAQLSDFADSYSKYFQKTYAVAMIFTVFCFVSSAILLRLDKPDVGVKVNVLSPMFNWYSFKSYQVIDLSYSITFFFMALFSIMLARLNDETGGEVGEVRFDIFIQRITFEEVIALFVPLAISCVADFLLYKIYWLFAQGSDEVLTSYVYYVLTYVRRYLPPVLFALTIRWILNGRQFGVDIKTVLFLLFSLWLFYGFVFEFFVLANKVVLDLLFLHFAKLDIMVLYKSLFSIPIMGLYFVGYYSALTNPLKMTDTQEPVVSYNEDIDMSL